MGHALSHFVTVEIQVRDPAVIHAVCARLKLAPRTEGTFQISSRAVGLGMELTEAAKGNAARIAGLPPSRPTNRCPISPSMFITFPSAP
jgi:hypothetical protein